MLPFSEPCARRAESAVPYDAQLYAGAEGAGASTGTGP